MAPWNRARPGLDPSIVAALQPVIADVLATSPVILRVQPWPDVEMIRRQRRMRNLVAMAVDSDGCGDLVTMSLDKELTAADQVQLVAEQVQDIVIEALATAGVEAAWPGCPLHPHTHPLEPDITRGRATWNCPSTNESIAIIGHLEPPSG